MDIRKATRDAAILGTGLLAYHTNTPSQYAGRQRQYFSPETKTFNQSVAKYSSDFVEARVQGIDPEHPFEWQVRKLRMSDIISPKTSATRNIDDYKIILFADRDIEYIVPGSKIDAMGSIWLMTNPMNISGSDGAGIVERCDCVWNYLDYYGNVRSEPMAIQNERANASDSDSQQSLYINKGYFNVVCQCNDFTRQLDTNSRVVIGKGAYRITGFPPLLREFTLDGNSARILKFTLRYEEPNPEMDDMRREIAEGKTFSWNIELTGPGQMRAGDRETFSAASYRCGAAVGPETETGYLWESSDESVAAVGPDGTVEAVGPGECDILCTLRENPEIRTSAHLAVSEAQTGTEAVFLSPIPDNLRPIHSATLVAALMENGQDTGEAAEWSFTGAQEGSYSATTEGNRATVTGYGYAPGPLRITARFGERVAEAEIRLSGL